MSRQRIPLSPGYHAEPGDTPGHLHEVYTTLNVPEGMTRLHVGTLTKDAVEAWGENALLRAIDDALSAEPQSTS